MGCGPPVSPTCTTPRSGSEESCTIIDGGNWRFAEGEPLPDFEAYCASQCVDFYGVFSISGQTDLRKAPILPKIRKLYSLDIGVDGLTDLTGLEKVEVSQLHLFSSSTEKSQSFKSLSGFAAEEADVFEVTGESGLLSLSSLALKRVRGLSLTETSVVDVDLSSIEAQNLGLSRNLEVRSLKLPSMTMQSVSVSANLALSNLSWDPPLKVARLVDIQSNPSLSSCTVQRLVDDSAPDGGRTVITVNNGPCP